jgi:predicted Abi (CAAX) family protease
MNFSRLPVKDNSPPGLRRWFRFGVSAIVSVIITIGWLHLPSVSAQQSSYALASQAPFNQPGYYPLEQTPNPALYRSTGEWLGRLVLPTVDQLQASAQRSSQTSAQADWVWVELYHTPPASQPLVGQVVRLTWQDLPRLQAYVKAVTTDVQFDDAALNAQQRGDVVPQRLNGRKQVGPLQSLAGARPQDDIIVRLEGVKVATNPAGPAVLQIAQAPVQVTGRYVGLVQILGPDRARAEVPDVCPGDSPCPSELYQVRHYNPAAGKFDGPLETVRIPQQPLDRNGRFLSTPRQIAESPAGGAGWYLYGAQDKTGMFTVQALKPRSLVQLQPDRVVLGEVAGLRYIREQNWQDTPERKGTLQRVLVSPNATTPAAAQQVWKTGDYALVVHSFGGIGGPKGEGAPGGTVTGHFAFGVAQVVPDPFTQELQFDIRYHQIYAHNPNAIVAGSMDWSAYAGDLQRGWLGSRPLSDVLIKLNVFTDLRLGDRQLSLLRELLIQTEIIAARYRTGDGTGISSVTPSTSCVQDSSQALYIALQQIKQQVLGDPELITWLAAHPDDPETMKFQHLVSLGKTLDAVLTPYGAVRPDWQQNADVLAGMAGVDHFTRGQTVMDALMSWRSMLPRRGHDEMAIIFLKHGAQLWFLRPNQVLGWDPTIAPIAPTLVLGQVPVVSTLLRRLTDALSMPATSRRWLITLGVLLGYGAIALPLGWRSGFLRWQPLPGNAKQLLCSLAQLFVMPALVEELVFRVALLPHPLEGATLVSWLGWGSVSLVLFVLYHPFSARTYYPAGNPTFLKPIFWVLSGLLGLACLLTYGWTGSLWTAVGVHWVVVAVWLWALGGRQRLSGLVPEN